jgi:hypothetical protein
VYPKVSVLSRNEIHKNNNNNNKNKQSLRSNTKGYGDKTNYTDSQNSDITARSSRELYHLQFSLQAAISVILDTTLHLKNHNDRLITGAGLAQS